MTAYTHAHQTFESPLLAKAKQLSVNTMALRKVYEGLRKPAAATFNPVFDCPECQKMFEAEVDHLQLKFSQGLK